MYRSHLRHMYQAWIQDNPSYVQDWHVFVDKSAIHLSMNAHDVRHILNNCDWFKQGWPPLSQLY